MERTQTILLTALAALVVSGCGGSANALLNQPSPRVRTLCGFQNVATTNSLAGTEAVGSNAAYGSVSDYAIAAEGNQTISFADTSAPIPVLASKVQLLTLASYTTAFGYGGAGNRQILVLSDTHDTTAGGMTSIRLVNVASVQGSVDVYLTSVGASLVGKTPIQLTLTSPTQVADYAAFTPGTYELRVFPAGVAAGTPLIDVSKTLAVGSRYTFAVLDAPTTGGAMQGTWLNDGP